MSKVISANKNESLRIQTFLMSVSLVFLMLFTFTACGKTDEERLIDDGLKGKELQDELKKISDEKAKLAASKPQPAPKKADVFDTFYKVVSPLYVDEVAEPAGDIERFMFVGNDFEMFNGGTSTPFSTSKDYWIQEVWTYHWNGGKGIQEGQIAIKMADGNYYGPWQGEVRNGVYLVATPKIILPAGNYEVIDSDPATWSQNKETNGQGSAWINGKAIINQ